MVNIHGDCPSVKQGELIVVSEDLGLCGARILDLNSTIGGEGCRVEGEGSVRMEVVFAVLEHDYSGSAARIR